MARPIERLTALKVEKAKQPGMYADGGGLYLRVTPKGARNWVLRYMLDRKPHWWDSIPSCCMDFKTPARRRSMHAASGMRE